MFSIKLSTLKDGIKKIIALIKYDSKEHFRRINDNWIVLELSFENVSPPIPTTSITHVDSMIEILSDNRIEKFGPNTIFSEVGMRFNGNKLVKFGYIHGKLLFIAFDQK